MVAAEPFSSQHRPTRHPEGSSWPAGGRHANRCRRSGSKRPRCLTPPNSQRIPGPSFPKAEWRASTRVWLLGERPLETVAHLDGPVMELFPNQTEKW